ncbi:MAG: transketolase, partial [Chloroflexota bacterium]
MREWMIREELATAAGLDAHEREDRRLVEEIRRDAHDAYAAPIIEEQERAADLLERAAEEAASDRLRELAADLRRQRDDPGRRFVAIALSRATVELRGRDGGAVPEVRAALEEHRRTNAERFTSCLYSRSRSSPLWVQQVEPTYAPDAELVDGRLVLVRCFDERLRNDPRVFIIGEDVGKLGDVNLVFEGLQAKHGELRVTDTGIREATILGQGIGAALRGLRPVVDIQYLDYLLYALQLASDDLATLHYRTAGGQKAPVIIRTKGHRLQGIWHTGSPMATVLSSLRGLRVAVPRNMTQAAGFYNTLFQGDDPALVIEVLSGYRLKERIPSNVGTFTVPLGVPEVNGNVLPERPT